jgi:mazG family protein
LRKKDRKLPFFLKNKYKSLWETNKRGTKFVPARKRRFVMENKMDTLEDLVRIIRILRSENGCPWDRVQTHASIRMDMLEEAYEAADAIDKKDMKNLCEELGDVLMQVVFHAEIETEQGGFTMGDVIQGICEKMIYRHPHVFGSGKADTAEEVLINWEELKKKEKRQETQTEVMQSVPEALPALIRARKVQKKAADVGFDFPVTADAMRKVYEEVQELEQAVRENGEIEEEFGDILFALVNISRFLKINPEFALTKAIKKFINRFEYIEKSALLEGKALSEMSLEEMDLLWDEAKIKLNPMQ